MNYAGISRQQELGAFQPKTHTREQDRSSGRQRLFSRNRLKKSSYELYVKKKTGVITFARLSIEESQRRFLRTHSLYASIAGSNPRPPLSLLSHNLFGSHTPTWPSLLFSSPQRKPTPSSTPILPLYPTPKP